MQSIPFIEHAVFTSLSTCKHDHSRTVVAHTKLAKK